MLDESHFKVLGAAEAGSHDGFWPTRAFIKDAAAMNYKQVSKSVHELIDLGLIEEVQRARSWGNTRELRLAPEGLRSLQAEQDRIYGVIGGPR